MKEKINQIIEQLFHGRLALVLIVVSIALLFLAGAFIIGGDRQDESKVPAELTREQTQELSDTKSRLSSYGIAGFDLSEPGINSTVSKGQVDFINIRSFVYTVTYSDFGSISSQLGVKSEIYNSDDEVRFLVDDARAFISSYSVFLNAAFSGSSAFVRLQETSRRKFNLDVEDGMDVHAYLETDEGTTHELVTYRIHINDDPLIPLTGAREVVFKTNLDTNESEISMPKFFPKKVIVSSRIAFKEGTYPFKPFFTDDPYFNTYMLETGTVFTGSNFNVDESSIGLMYIFSVDKTNLIPFMYRSARVGETRELGIDNNVYLLNY